MKKALNLIITYFLFLIFGLIFGTILYSLFLDTMQFVIGDKSAIFSIDGLIKSGIYVGYCIVFLICPVICYYRVRHPAGIAQTIAYVFVCLFTWGVLLPGLNMLNSHLLNVNKYTATDTSFSYGYFRPSEDKVYYFTKDFKFKTLKGLETTGVIIDTSEDGKVSVEQVFDNYTLNLNQLANPYKEIQEKTVFEENKKSIPLNFSTLISVANLSFEEGFTAYLAFLSLAVLLSIVYCFSNLFEWRLLNTTLIFFSTVSILFFNSFYYSSSFINMKIFLTDNKFFTVFEKIVNEPLLFVINNFVSIVIIVFMIVRTIVKKHKAKSE